MKRLFVFLVIFLSVTLAYFFLTSLPSLANVYDGVYGTCYFNDFGYQPQGIACAPVYNSCSGTCVIDQFDGTCGQNGGYDASGGDSNSCALDLWNSSSHPFGAQFPWGSPFLTSDPTHCCVLPSCTQDLNGECPRLGHNCQNGYTFAYANSAADNSCSAPDEEQACCTRIQECNNSAVTSGGCDTSQYDGTNTCGTISSTIKKTYTKYKNCDFGYGICNTPSSTCTQVVGNAGSSTCSVFHDDCTQGAGYTCHNNTVCVTSIFITVSIDWNHNGTADIAKSGVTINDGGGNTDVTDSGGAASFGLKAMGNYTITMTTPANYQVIASTAKTNAGANNNTHGSPSNITSFNMGINNGNEHVTYNVTPLYNISGEVFDDKNKNQQNDGGDSGYGVGKIHISGGPTAVADITVAGNGTWTTPTTLQSGTYTVAYSTSLANGYNFTTPSSFTVTVGDPAGSIDCSVGQSLDATCGGTNNGSIANLDFGVSNENPWQQSVCFDVRDDSGTYTDQIPVAPSCGGVTGAYNAITNGDCSTGAGIIFTCDATPDFGLGSANANGWQAGGPGTQQECFINPGLDVVRTSYDYLLTTAQESGITPTDLTTVCNGGNLASCTLPSDLPKGIYQAEGDVHIANYTFPVDSSSPQSFIFLIHGNLYIDGNILVPAGSVAAFSTSGNIYVDKGVGNVVSNPNSPSVNNPNIEGLYSADASFIIQSYGTGTDICNADGTPLDKRLNIVGSVVTNAAQQGGSLVNNRDLCVYDLQCSSVSLGDGNPDTSGSNDENLALSYILTLFGDGQFLNHKLFNWQELKP